ncbi:phage tail spike protein [Cytobacillus firmus]|uniref:phage tail spike protein n=1 Tax=Cytobacillus firmus TaxID=1399 RepID=UPI0018CD0CA5|nr:phage tail spike protein [Cytobacillus firmus]MED1940816.1 phage tail spike protein [Cytobacillus firmus]
MIHVSDGLTDKILSVIDKGEFWNDIHYKSLRDTMETFDFVTFGNKPFSAHLGKRNRIVVPDEDGRYVEFIISNARKYRSGQDVQFTAVKSNASYLELRKAKVISPGKRSSQSISTLVSLAIGGTEWRAGRLEGFGTRTINIEKHTDPYSLLKMIETEFKLELQFRIEIRSNRIVGRYVDLVQRIGEWRGREVEFGHDLIGIERIEDTDNIVTALVGIGPAREDGTRLEVTVSDSDAWQRWGRIDPATGQRAHIIEKYEPQSNDQDMTLERLTTLTENELEKRINAIIEYKAEAVDLENVPGLKNKKVRFGDSIRVKDSKFDPPIYLDTRVHTQERSISDPSKKNFTLGDFIEYSEEDIHALWNSMQLEIQRKLAKLLIVNVESSAGDVFKNGAGTTTLTSRVFLTGTEVDQGGDLYSYSWTKHDKDGVRDMAFARAGKSIVVTSADVDTKATFFVDIGFNGEVIQTGQFTITDLYDGQDGEQGPAGPQGPQGPQGVQGLQGPQGDQGIQGPPGEDGKSSYTHIAYAKSSDGTVGFSVSDSTNKEYIGIYVDNIPDDSTDPGVYNWTLIKGAKGDQGLPGPTGEDGLTPYFHTAWADSADGTVNFSTTTAGTRKYLGTYTDYTAADSVNPAAYTWAKIQGPQGERGPQGLQGIQGPQGDQGIQGPPGEDGVSSYTHIAYADSSDGSIGFSVSDSVGKEYIGIYVDSNPTDSTNPADYAWTLIKGADGAQGLPGPKGADGKTPYFHTAWANNATGTSGFSTTDATGRTYIGTYTDFTAADSSDPSKYTWQLVKGEKGDTGPQGPQGIQGLQGPKGDQGIQGPKGADGLSSYTHVAYANSADGQTGFSVSDSTNKLYIGIYVDHIAADSTDPTKYAWTLIKGADGEQGLPGPAGADGRTPYFHTAWATNSTGTAGFSTTSSVGKTYIGTYTDYTAADSTDPSKYNWVLIKGDKGDTGAQGPQGPQGLPGFVLSWNTTGTVTVDSQGRLSKLTGSSTWDSQAYSTESYTGGAFLTFKAGVNANNVMIGLNSDPATDASYTSIDFAFYLRSAGTFSFYESGTSRGTATPFAVGDVFSVVYDNTEVSYYHNGNLVRTVAAPSGRTLSVDSSFGTVSSKSPHIYDLYFSPAAAKGPQGPTGPTGPQGPNIVDSTTQIEANVIKANHIDVSNLSAIVANLGKVTAGELTGVKLETDDGLGSKVIINNGEIEAFRNGNKIAAINKHGFQIYDDQVNGQSVGIIRDERDTATGTLSLGINSYRDELRIGFMKDADLSSPWIELNKADEQTVVSGANIDGVDRGRLFLKATRHGGSANGMVPMVKLYNYTSDVGAANQTYWSGIIMNTGRDNSTPNASNKRFGFEVWQYRGTGDGAEKQMMRLDTETDGTTYAAFYTDKSYIPRPLLRADNNQYYWAAGVQISSYIEGLHGVQNANNVFFVDELIVTCDAGQTTGYRDYNFSGAENIFHVQAQVSGNNSYRFAAAVYNQTGTGFRIHLNRVVGDTANSYSIPVRLLILFEP